MLTDSELKQRLWDYGHFFSPEALAIDKVKEEDLPMLSLDDKVVKAATRSMQTFMSPVMDHLTMKLGQPLGSYVGEMDEPTRLMMEVPRCGQPDFLDPEKRKAIGAGSWPEPCQKAGVKVHLNKQRMPSQIPIDAVIADVVAAYASVGLKIIFVNSATEANIDTYWTPLAGGTIGIAQFNSRSCSGRVWCKLDTGYAGYMRSLIAHEWGHNCNLEHTRGGIMNPSILPDPSPFGWHKTDPSYSTLKRFFGGDPLVPDQPPPIDPGDPKPPPVSGGTLRLPLTMTDADGRKFHLILWPTV